MSSHPDHWGRLGVGGTRREPPGSDDMRLPLSQSVVVCRRSSEVRAGRRLAA